jgi:hypothetical protein
MGRATPVAEPMVRVEIHLLAWAFVSYITLVRRRIPEITVIIAGSALIDLRLIAIIRTLGTAMLFVQFTVPLLVLS